MAHILVVDDEESNRVLLLKMLKLGGHTVITAGDGHEALRLAEQKAPDLILMDMSMPHMDGWSATMRLKRQPHLSHIPVIALTAHAMLNDRERAIQAGCDDYLSKPFDYMALINMISAHL